MKILFDYLPLILFFSVFKWAGHDPVAAHAIANDYFAGLVAGGAVAVTQAPMLLATVSTIAMTSLQIGWQIMQRKKVDLMLWVTFAIIAVFGSATIYFNNEIFIKWKPTILYWIFASALLISDLLLDKNLTRSAMVKLFDAPEAVWRRLNLQWAIFFAGLGGLNLYVAYHFSTDDWVTFKLFGATGLTFAWLILNMIPLMKYMKDTDPT